MCEKCCQKAWSKRGGELSEVIGADQLVLDGGVKDRPLARQQAVPPMVTLRWLERDIGDIKRRGDTSIRNPDNHPLAVRSFSERKMAWLDPLSERNLRFKLRC